MDNESQSIKELEQEVENKKNIYTSLLKESPSLYKIHRMIKFTDISGSLGMCLALAGIVSDLSISLLGAIIFVVTIIISYCITNRFDRLFAETASDPLKNARKEYEGCEQKLKEAKEASNKAKKEAERAKLQAEIEEAEQTTTNGYVQDDDDNEDDEETDEEFTRRMVSQIYDQELAIPHAIYHRELSDMIHKNAFSARSLIGKVILLAGDITKIDYDKERKMPYILMGTGHYFSGSHVCDEYACYFSEPKQIELLKQIQVGEMAIISGIFTDNKNRNPSDYVLIKSYILHLQ